MSIRFLSPPSPSSLPFSFPSPLPLSRCLSNLWWHYHCSWSQMVYCSQLVWSECISTPTTWPLNNKNNNKHGHIPRRTERNADTCTERLKQTSDYILHSSKKWEYNPNTNHHMNFRAAVSNLNYLWASCSVFFPGGILNSRQKLIHFQVIH